MIGFEKINKLGKVLIQRTIGDKIDCSVQKYIDHKMIKELCEINLRNITRYQMT